MKLWSSITKGSGNGLVSGMSKKKIFVHIGTYKTGTSSIQTALYQKREDLRRMGIHYLETGLHPTFYKHMGIFDYCHQAAHNRHRRKRWKGVDLAALVKEEIAQSNAHSFIISEESLSVPNVGIAQKLSFLKDIAEVQIVYCVRRQDKFLESLFLQFVKESGRALKKPFVEFIHDQNYLRYAKFDEIADDWASIFGQENILVLDFEELKEQDKLIPTFANIFGIHPDFDLPDIRLNETISHEIAEIIRRFALVYPRVDRDLLTLSLMDLKSQIPPNAYIAPKLHTLLPRYEESNVRLKSSYNVDLLKYKSSTGPLSPEIRQRKDYYFERRINKILMLLMKKAHREKSWDFMY